MRSYIGNRVFTVKHDRSKLCHGPLTGHVRPVIKHLPSFDGSTSMRLVFVPHELRDFDHDMWMQRRSKVVDRLQRQAIRDAELPELDDIVVSGAVYSEHRSDVSDADGVELSFLEDGRLASASFGDDENEPVRHRECRVRHRTCRPTRKDWVRSARLMC